MDPAATPSGPASVRGFPRAIAATAGALLSIPIVVDLLISGRNRPFDLLAPDAFYYFTVARNISRLGKVSFDQEHPTNGFHPLWQMLMAGVHWLLDRLPFGEPLLLSVALGIGAVLASLGVYLVGRAAAFERLDLSILFVLVPFGLLSPVFDAWLATWGYGSVRTWCTAWSAVNGMETAVVLFCFGASAWLFVRQTPAPRRAWLLGLALAGLSLSRLDHAVFALLCVVFLGFEAATTRPDLRRSALLVAAVWVACLLTYLVVNRVYAGMWLPVSGTTKSTFPTVTPQHFEALGNLLTGEKLAKTLAARELIILLPGLVAVVYPLCVFQIQRVGARIPRVALRPGRNRYTVFLVLTAVGVVVLALYNVLYVPPMNIGRWYFPVSVLFVSLAGVEAVGHIVYPARWAWLGSSFVRGTAVAALSLCVLSLYGNYRRVGSGAKAAKFYYQEASRIAAAYAGSVPPLVELDDGIVAFTTGAKSFSGWGLAIDRGAVPFVRALGKRRGVKPKGHLMDLAIKRGYARIATLNYGRARLTLKSSDRQIREAYRMLLRRFAKRHRFKVEYLSKDRRFSIIVAKPRPRKANSVKGS